MTTKLDLTGSDVTNTTRSLSWVCRTEGRARGHGTTFSRNESRTLRYCEQIHIALTTFSKNDCEGQSNFGKSFIESGKEARGDGKEEGSILVWLRGRRLI